MSSNQRFLGNKSPSLILLFMGNYRSALSQKEVPYDPTTLFLFTPIQSDIRLTFMCLDFPSSSICCLLGGMTPACSTEMLKRPSRSCLFCTPHPNTHPAPHWESPRGRCSVFSEQFTHSSPHCSSHTAPAVAQVSSSSLGTQPISLMEGILCASCFPVLHSSRILLLWV